MRRGDPTVAIGVIITVLFLMFVIGVAHEQDRALKERERLNQQICTGLHDRSNLRPAQAYAVKAWALEHCR